MEKKRIRYIAELRGSESPRFYLDRLRSDPAYSLVESAQERNIVVETSGPRKSDTTVSLSDLRQDLSDRAKQLGIHFPQLVESASQQVYDSQTAEEIVLSGKMQMEISKTSEQSLITVVLEVALQGKPDIDTCIEQYSFLRIVWLANAMGLTIETCIAE